MVEKDDDMLAVTLPVNVLRKLTDWIDMSSYMPCSWCVFKMHG